MLVQMIIVDGIPDPEDAEEWEKDWLDFARHYGGELAEVLDPGAMLLMRSRSGNGLKRW